MMMNKHDDLQQHKILCSHINQSIQTVKDIVPQKL